MSDEQGSERQEGVWSRFMEVITDPLNRRSVATVPDEAPERTPAEVRTLLLADWATRSDCRDHFMPFLDTLIADADEAISVNIASHPGIAYATGARDALRTLQRHFQSWAGTGE